MAGEPTEQQFESPNLEAFAEAVVRRLVSVENVSRIWQGSEPTLFKVVEVALGAIVAVAGTAGAELAKAIVNAEDIAEPAFQRLTRVALKDITGIDANIGPGGGGRDGREAAARNVGAGILRALTGISGADGTGAGPLQPSTKAAEDYLSFVVQMSLEGWLTGLMGEMMTLGAVENLGDLDDALANSLGLARTSRAVMQPFINATVATPATWQVNKTYRPELLSAALAVKMYTRKRWTREQLFEELARQGWSDERIEALIADAEKRPSLATVLRAVETEYVSTDEAKSYLLDEGYTEQIADWVLLFEEHDRIEKFHAQLADAAAAAYVARKIESGDFDRILAEAQPRARERARVRELAELRRAVNRKSLSESDAFEAVKRGIIAIPTWRRLMVENGYDEESIAIKELLLQGDLRDEASARRARDDRDAAIAAEKAAKAAEAARRKAEIDAERAVTEPSLSQVEKLVIRGIWTFEDYRAFLAAEKYDAATIAGLVASVEQDRLEYVARQAAREQASNRGAAKAIALADLEDAVLRELASVDDYRRRLVADRYAAADVALLVATLEDRIAERAELLARRTQVVTAQPDKGLSLAQAEDSVLRGVMTTAAFESYLTAEGYGAFDRAVLVELLNRKIADTAAAAARRQEQEAAAAARAVPVADIRRAVLRGLRPIDDYAAALVDARTPAADRALLLDLLAAELDERAQAEARRRELADRQLTRGLTLAQLEQAVVVGAATVEQYHAQLVDEGYSAADIETLTSLLLERITDTQRARARRRELAGEDAGRALTIAQVERAVRAGIRTVEDYGHALTAAGYRDEDRDALQLLLASEIAEARDARARRAALADEIARAGVSLAVLARAVRIGERPLDDYAAALRAAGVQPADVSTLVALLDREIADADAAAARRRELAADDPGREISLGQFERAVRAGVRTIAEYGAFLVDQGYSLVDQATLIELLQQQLDKAAGAAAAAEDS
jgi:hypothetical protein